MAVNRASMELLAQDLYRLGRAGVREGVHRTVLAAGAKVGRAPGAPVKTQELKGSLRVTIGSPSSEEPQKRPFYPLIGATEVDSALAGWELGQEIWLKWIAEHANIIEGGRRPDKRGRMIGSDQAPAGFARLATEEAAAQMEGWVWQGP